MFAAQQDSVFPTNFTANILILIYACLVLGGVGSIAGAILGGIVVTVAEEMLSSPTDSAYLFYGLILVALIVARPTVAQAAARGRRGDRVRLRRARDRRRDLAVATAASPGQRRLDRLGAERLRDRSRPTRRPTATSSTSR